MNRPRLQNSYISYTIHINWYLEVKTMVTMTSVEAQNSFGKLLDTAQREAVTITRHGRRKRSRAVADLEAWRAQAAKRATAAQTAAADALTDEDVTRMVHASR